MITKINDYLMTVMLVSVIGSTVYLVFKKGPTVTVPDMTFSCGLNVAEVALAAAAGQLNINCDIKPATTDVVSEQR